MDDFISTSRKFQRKEKDNTSGVNDRKGKSNREKEISTKEVLRNI